MSAKINFQHPIDGFYQIEPKGNHPSRDKSLTQVVDDRAANSIVNRFNADANDGKLSHGHEMLIDREHWKHDLDKETTAYGWLQELQNRADGIYGKIRWTNTGQAAVDGGDYRFFSTEYAPADFQILNRGEPVQARPLRLDGLTLTNQPNNHNMKPITNRAEMVNPTGKASEAVAASAETEQARHDKITEPIAKWFQAIAQVKGSANTHLRHNLAGNIGFHQAWDLAKIHYPDEYAAAHGLVSDTPDGDTASDVQLARNQLSEVVNRISRMAGCSLPFAYQMAEQQFPALLNRLKPAATRILNRKKLDDSPKALQQTAVKLLNRQIRAEINLTGCPHSVCFSRVMNREQVIGKFASGMIPAVDVMVNHPDTWFRLQVELE